MSIQHYYIGVGGTGARVAEALVHLCAAGLGPEELFLMLIDPDAGNGNLSRTTELISRYQEIQAQIGTRADGVSLFRTRIVTPTPLVWTIFKQQNQTLSSFIALNSLEASAKPLKHLAEMLFTEGDLDERLNEGFRGRPAIGAVVMAQPGAELPPWSQFWEQIALVSREDEAKVFVVGSIFGGTGAAGIPTLGAAAVIRDRAALESDTAANSNGGRKKSKVYLGSCLVLPYFSFTQDVPADERGRNFVRPDDFPLATSAALHYYLTKQLAYDEMYLIGDSSNEVVGSFGAGAGAQKNRAHYVELGAALSALDFFTYGKPTTSRETQYFFSARNGETVDWGALPSSRRADAVVNVQTSVKYRLVSATMFFYAASAYGSKTLKAMDGAGVTPPTWFTDHFAKKARLEPRMNPRSPDQEAMIGRLDSFGESFLHWLRDIGGDRSVALTNMRALLDDSGALLAWRSAPVGQLNGDGSSKLQFETFVGSCLNEPSLLKANAGAVAADRYFNLFSLAADRFTQKYLNVQNSQAER